MLSACSDAALSEPKTTDTSSNEAQVAVEKEQAISNTAADTNKLTEQQADQIVTDLIKTLTEQTLLSVDNKTATTVNELKALWTAYATENYIEDSFAYADQYESCEEDYCGLLYQLPSYFTYAWHKEFSIQSDEIRASGVLSSNFSDTFNNFSNGQKIQVQQINGDWKINSVDIHEQDMNLTEEELSTYLASFLDEIVDEFDYSTMMIQGIEEEVYTFSHPEDGEPYIIIPRTGFIVSVDLLEEYYLDS